nr:four helix bundle protein [Bacteroidota bacterium]
MYHSFEELDVWKRGCKLAVETYKALKGCKEFELKNQMIKSAISIPSNIAEGAERNSKKEFIQFLHIAKGSAAELRTQFYIAEKAEILPSKTTRPFIKETKELSSMLQGLINSIKIKSNP